MEPEKDKKIREKCEIVLGDLNSIMIEVVLLTDGLRHNGYGSLDEFVKYLERTDLYGDLVIKICEEKKRFDSVINELKIT